MCSRHSKLLAISACTNKLVSQFCFFLAALFQLQAAHLGLWAVLIKIQRPQVQVLSYTQEKLQATDQMHQ